MPATNLTLSELRTANRKRCAEWHDGGPQWDHRDWMVELCEEVGEVAGKLKRMKRAQDGMVGGMEMVEALEAVAKEIADVFIVGDLLADCLDIDLERIIRRKFNETSQKHGFVTKL